MNVISSIDDMQKKCLDLRFQGKKIGFVPTMGALHKGHVSLLQKARESSDVVVLSIYVNPTQFGPTEDFDSYPRPLDTDLEIASREGCDIVFTPNDTVMYPSNYNTYVNVEKLTTHLCGATRLNHFRGVTTIVLKLFNIVQPTHAVFGHKDAQQALIIKRMSEDLNIPVKIIVGETLREKDGLAISSRNAYLTHAERNCAPAIYQTLTGVKDAFTAGEHDVAVLKDIVHKSCSESRLMRMEYFEIVDLDTISPLTTIPEKALAAMACRTTESGTRLIDNIVLGGSL